MGEPTKATKPAAIAYGDQVNALKRDCKHPTTKWSKDRQATICTRCLTTVS
jgi:hypothetical protein